MFNSKNNKDKGNTMANNNHNNSMGTLVGENTRIKGDITFTGTMHVEGHIEGSIISETDTDTLTITESGSVGGKIKTGNLIINGQVEGDITASGKIGVASKARINGNIYYMNIEMETGSQVSGQLIYQGGEVTPLVNKKAEKDG